MSENEDIIIDRLSSFFDYLQEREDELENGLLSIHKKLNRIILRDWQPQSIRILELYQRHLSRVPTSAEMAAWQFRFCEAPLTDTEIIGTLMEDPDFQHTQPPKPEPEQPKPEPKILTARFLRNGAQWATHGLMALSDGDKVAMLDQAKQDGNAFNFYLWCDGDYAGRYQLAYDGNFDHWFHWTHYEMRVKRGMEPIAWLMSDDGFKHFNRGDIGKVKEKWSHAITTFLRPAQIKNVVLGLEAVEYWSDAQIDELGRWLKAAYPECVLGFHTHPDDERHLASPWVDVIYYQYGFGKDEAFIKSKTQHLIRTYNKPVIAAEYSLDGDPVLGRAAVAAGALGALNGY